MKNKFSNLTLLNGINSFWYCGNIWLYSLSSRKLKISKVDVSFGFDTYADYKKSIFTDGDKLDIDLEWIKKNQFNFFEYINKISILANRRLMDSDMNTMLSYFISEIREEKINKILN